MRELHNPPNPFAHMGMEYEPGERPKAQLAVYTDNAKNVVSKNDSEDIPASYSVNPYQGCLHACAYCYARPYHEYWGFGAGTDFERKLVIKPDAPKRLDEYLRKHDLRDEYLLFSGATDCYQPLEATYKITQSCLKVCLEHDVPVGIITKSALIERDIDLLAEIHAQCGLHVSISLPFWDREIARALEPFAAVPERRVRTIERLRARGLSVGISVAPFIPELSESELLPLMRAAHGAGATGYLWGMLHLAGSSHAVFEKRLREAFPLRADKIMARLRDIHPSENSHRRPVSRMRGVGPYADLAKQLLERTARQVGLPKYNETRPVAAAPVTRPRPGHTGSLF